ncbi:MAG: DUF4433 domain-containing protein [Gemmatimonadaceae bacterium]
MNDLDVDILRALEDALVRLRRVPGGDLHDRWCLHRIATHMGNHAELTYREGQDSIVHLEADLHQVVNWAQVNGRRWAFSLSNAGAVYAEFRDDLADLHEINWAAVHATDFRPPDIKEGKQAEFLMQQFFPWSLIQRIGVRSRAVFQQVLDAIAGASHQPKVEIIPAWYY